MIDTKEFEHCQNSFKYDNVSFSFSLSICINHHKTQQKKPFSLFERKKAGSRKVDSVGRSFGFVERKKSADALFVKPQIKAEKMN